MILADAAADQTSATAQPSGTGGGYRLSLKSAGVAGAAGRRTVLFSSCFSIDEEYNFE